MRTPILALAVALIGAGATTRLGAQGAVGQPGAAVTGGGGGDYRSSTAENAGDRLFDVNSDSIDMENG
jgi:hypothetical protein